MPRPSFLATEEPLDALYHHFNVCKAVLPAGAPLPPQFAMPVLHDTHTPTHVLAVSDPNSAPAPLLMAPVDTNLYLQGFRVDIFPQAPPGTISPVPHRVPHSHAQLVTLPVVPISIPHAPSVPLLLLFALRLESDLNLISWRLLPPQAIEEFPNAAAMAQAMARACGDDELQRFVVFNQGLWKNILALGPRDARFVELVQTVWNVTAEARRIRQRGRRATVIGG